MQTQAIIFGEDHVARLVDITLPAMNATRVRIENIFSGVSCGTEGDCLSGRATYMQRPVITGYQSVGKVVEVGDHVDQLRVDDLVFTMGGELWEQRTLGGGSHARQLVVEANDAHKLPNEMSFIRSASYASLAAVAAEGLQRMKPEPGSVLLVLGLGMLGHIACRIGQLHGLRVIGVNRTAWKRELAKTFGCDVVCAPDAVSIHAAVKNLGFGMPKYVVDTTGHSDMFNLALDHVDCWGQVSLLGYYPDKVLVDFDITHGKQLLIHSPVGYGDRVPAVLKWIIEKRLNLESLIKHTIRPRQITAFYKDLNMNHSQYLGVVIDWATDLCNQRSDAHRCRRIYEPKSGIVVGPNS